ncbi:MAG: cyclic nucleotide-binding domain-containing protein [Stellaceae bacterium]
MRSEGLYQLVDAGARGTGARAFRAVHHAMLATGIGIMLANTEPAWRLAWPDALDIGFLAVCAFFFAEYVLRLAAAPGAPGAELRGEWRARLAWAISIGGICDLVGVVPGVLAVVFDPATASLFGFVWVFKVVRYAPGLAGLQRVISDARQALLSVLLGFGMVLLLAASLAYLLERSTQPKVFGSLPAALWWAIVTLTTTGYGDAVPATPVGRLLAGVVMVSGIIVFALWAGILATGFAEETRRREFLRTWDLVAKVPIFHNVGAAVIADVARLLRPREYPAGAVIVRRGEPGDCMYFVVSGEVEVQIRPEPVFLGSGDFFGEVALLTSGRRNATVTAVRQCTLLRLDIVDFRELLGRQPDLARVIHEEAERRPGGAARSSGRGTRRRRAPSS